LQENDYRYQNRQLSKHIILIEFGPKISISDINKNLAIANRSRVSCAHNTLRAFIGLNITLWPWNLC